ncbi:MAG: hypothetical protein CSA62_08450 [Planctomycetota bacterium]|nr:MAG: hypothetical protein CSA62_08450 [Planctomycetota bacterium]
MSCLRSLLLAACALLGLGSASLAQHVVDPAGNGTHKDLQAAIDAAKAGDWIRVRGGTWEQIVVRKSLTLLGDPMPTLLAPFNGVGFGKRQPPPLHAVGKGREYLRLVDIRIEGLALGSGSWSSLSPAIKLEGWGRLELLRCHVRGMAWFAPTGLANGAPAIASDGPVQIHASDSWIAASDSMGSVGPSRVDGAAGIDTPRGQVILSGSTVLGGAAAKLFLVACPATPCPCPQFRHRGGPAVRAQSLYHYGGILQGGAGGELWCWQGSSLVRKGQQPDGARYQARSSFFAARDLRSRIPPQPGGVWVLAYPLLKSGGILILGDRAQQPQILGPDRLWMDALKPLLVLVLPPSSVELQLRLPKDPRLVGLVLSGQSFNLATWRVGAPVLEVVGF